MDTKEKLSNFYISFTNVRKKELVDSGLVLKHDYLSSETLHMIRTLANIDIPQRFYMVEHQTFNSFFDNLCDILTLMDNDRVNDFFSLVLPIVKTNRIPNLNLLDCRARIIQNGEDIHFAINIPDRGFESDALHAAIIHELCHFSLFLGKDRTDIFEYSEALSMFFEYMMYSTINHEKGKEKFIRNRVSMLKDGFEDLRQDILYASNPDLLGIDRNYYKLPLAFNLAYPESLEFVLQLLERREVDKKYVDEYIGRILLGQETMDSLGYDLEIETKDYPLLTKTIR